MPFWIYGRDKSSKRPCDPLFVETEDEEVARAQAVTAGIEIEELEQFQTGTQRRIRKQRASEPPCPFCGETHYCWGTLNGANARFTRDDATIVETLLLGAGTETVKVRLCEECGNMQFFAAWYGSEIGESESPDTRIVDPQGRPP